MWRYMITARFIMPIKSYQLRLCVAHGIKFYGMGEPNLPRRDFSKNKGEFSFFFQQMGTFRAVRLTFPEKIAQAPVLRQNANQMEMV